MTAPPSTPAATARHTLPGMRALLAVFCALTALAVGALFVLSGNTTETFAWTIQPPVTAAFLGAGYGAGFVLVVLSLRDPVWAHSRVPVLTVLVFVVLTLAATLLHFDRLHLAADAGTAPALAVGASWFWLAVYVVVPVGMAVLLVAQERAPGADPAPRHPVPRVLRLALAVESAVLGAVGAVLFVAPTTAAGLWPWELTPFTARVVAAWLIAFGLATGVASVTGDLARLRSAAVAYTVFGLLVLVTLARFPGSVEWGAPAAWVLLGTTLAVVATGAAGRWLAPSPERTDG